MSSNGPGTPQGEDAERIVFIGGHEIGCDRDSHYSCDCNERYEAIFNRCSECAAPLDRWGECTEPEEHLYA